ncbi:hypothetical protein E9529_18190 [Blastococcus sp. KM273128]|nr:hypothetical protein [Blastococcus sp. KM273128]
MVPAAAFAIGHQVASAHRAEDAPGRHAGRRCAAPWLRTTISTSPPQGAARARFVTGRKRPKDLQGARRTLGAEVMEVAEFELAIHHLRVPEMA